MTRKEYLSHVVKSEGPELMASNPDGNGTHYEFLGLAGGGRSVFCHGLREAERFLDGYLAGKRAGEKVERGNMWAQLSSLRCALLEAVSGEPLEGLRRKIEPIILVIEDNIKELEKGGTP